MSADVAQQQPEDAEGALWFARYMGLVTFFIALACNLGTLPTYSNKNWTEFFGAMAVFTWGMCAACIIVSIRSGRK